MRHGSQLTGLSRVRNVLTATITQSDKIIAGSIHEYGPPPRHSLDNPWLPAWIAPASASAPTSWRREAELPVGHSPDDYVAARGSIEPGRLSERGRFPAFVRADEPGDLTG